MQVKDTTITNLTQSIDEQDTMIIAQDLTIIKHEALLATANHSLVPANMNCWAWSFAGNIASKQSLGMANKSLFMATNKAQELESSLAMANAGIEELASAAEAAKGVIGAASTRQCFFLAHSQSTFGTDVLRNTTAYDAGSSWTCWR
jgi:hypothetical protein